MPSWWYRYERSERREAKGGIRPQSQRGTFGETWWAERWVQVLESFDIGARLGRGRSYARTGQVLSIKVAEGGVTAWVQGSRPEPYRVTIRMRPISEEGWLTVAEILSRQAIFTAKLLAGEMPDEIETVFAEAGLSLFPEKHSDLVTDCSCPDWSNPCKHIAAVYYLLGEEFDRDPFLLFQLRDGRRADCVALLSPAGAENGAVDEPPPPPEPLPTDPIAFWGTEPAGAALDGEVVVPTVHAALPKRLGGFPFWRGRESLLSVLEPIYALASAVGVDVLSRSAGHDGGA